MLNVLVGLDKNNVIFCGSTQWLALLYAWFDVIIVQANEEKNTVRGKGICCCSSRETGEGFLPDNLLKGRDGGQTSQV